jgi:hypothetical protein
MTKREEEEAEKELDAADETKKSDGQNQMSSCFSSP